MKLLKERILQDGILIEDRILKVDNFLNHQLDIGLFNEIGKEFKKRFEKKEITKILTVETSGVGIACIAAQYFNNVPVVFAKKHAGSNMDEDVYEAEVYSYTKDKKYTIKVSKKYIDSNDKVLVIDDFLASGSAVSGLLDISSQSGAVVQGVGIVIEKKFQNGRKIIEDQGIQVESLAILKGIENGKVIFAD